MLPVLSATVSVPLGAMAAPEALPASRPVLTPRAQCEGDWDFWLELMGAMLNAGRVPARAKIAACRAALSAGDATALRLEAHALKSSSAALCVTELCRLCVALERAAAEGDVSSWARLVDAMDTAVAKLEVSYKFVRSLGTAERNAAFEAVNGWWEALGERQTQ